MRRKVFTSMEAVIQQIAQDVAHLIKKDSVKIAGQIGADWESLTKDLNGDVISASRPIEGAHHVSILHKTNVPKDVGSDFENGTKQVIENGFRHANWSEMKL